MNSGFASRMRGRCIEVGRARMPRKKREIRSDLRRIGFVQSSGKGSHTNFRHPKLPYMITVSGADGDDAKPYDEDNLRHAKKDLGVKLCITPSK